MSGFDAVQSSVCQVLAADGSSIRGTAFRVLPAGFLLTCHHVVAGLSQIRVRTRGSEDAVDATYVERWSDPVADIAVLQLAEAGEAVQVARMPGVGRAYGYGFRPGTVRMEREGHTFSGAYGPGQSLEIAVSERLIQRLGQVPQSERQPWNLLPERFRVGDVRNFTTDGGLEQGISGGPVYDPDLRKVVGLFRAVEGEERAYVLPIDDVLIRWPELEQENAAEVPDEQLDTLAAEFGVQPVKMGRPVTPTLRSALEPFFPRARTFGGRRDELHELDQFLEARSRPHLLITGDAGIGKTSLLAEWISGAEGAHTGVKVAYHFISSRVDHGTEQRACFENLCEQLMAHQRVGGDLPLGDLRLRALYRRLLQLEPPPGEHIVVVIDGLDEALGSWTPGGDMFPEELPPHVQTIVSARTMADTDWRERLALDDRNSEVLRLSQLSEDGVREVVERTAQVAADQRDVVSRRVWDLSLGDPYYVQDLLDHLVESGGMIEALAEFPIGHSNYLRTWWSSASVDNNAFVDLMGLLAVAHAPLTRTELVAISTEDAVRDANFPQLVSLAARHVTGEETSGYRLSSTRLRDFVRTQIGNELSVYETRLADFSLRWRQKELPSTTRDYIFAYGAEHLASSRRYEQLLDLLGPEWMAAKWRRYGSFGSLIHDIDLTAALAATANPPDVPRVAALGVARATARSLTQSVPPALLTALGRLGEHERLLELMRTADQVPDESPATGVRQRLAAAAELAVGEEPGRAGRSEAIQTMYLDALGRVESFSGPEVQIEVLEAITEALGQAPERTREAVVEEAVATVLAGLGDARVRAAGLGMLADVAATLPERRHEAERIRDDAQSGIDSLLEQPDRIAVTAFLIPVSAKLDGQASALALAKQTSIFPFALQWSALSPVAATPLVRRWAALNVVDANATEWLLEMADRCLLALTEGGFGSETDGDRPVAGALIGHCAACLLGNSDTEPRAMSLLERTDAASLSAGVAAVRSLLAHPARPRPAAALDWLARAAPELDPPELVYWYARLGEIERVHDTLRRLAPAQAAPAAIAALDGLRQLDDAERQMGSAADEVLRQLQDRQDELSPDVLAHGAASIARHAPDRARELADRATALVVAPPPPEDIGNLQTLRVAALHTEGRVREAAEAATAISSYDIAATALAWLIRHAIAESPVPAAQHEAAAPRWLRRLMGPRPQEAAEPSPDIAPYVGVLARMITASQGNFKTLETAGALTKDLKHPFPMLAEQLRGEIASSIVTGFDAMAQVSEVVARNPRAAVELGVKNVTNMLEMIRWTAPVVPDRAAPAAAGLLAVGDYLPARDRIQIKAFYAEAVQEIDPLEYARVVDDLLASAMNPSSADAVSAYTVLTDHGDLVAERMGGDRRAALRWLLDRAVALGGEAAPVLFAFFWLAYRSLGSAEGIDEVVEDALSALEASEPVEGREVAAVRAVEELANAGRLDAARRADALLTQEDPSTQVRKAREALSTREKVRELGDLSTFEQFYLQHDPAGFAELLLRQHHVEHDPEPYFDAWLRALANDLLLGGRAAVCEVGVYTLLYSAYLRGGADLVSEIVASVEDFDQRFADIARLLRTSVAV